MKIVLVTTGGNQLGGVFATAYHNHGGPPFESIIVLPPRKDISFPLWAQGYVAYKLFGVEGMYRLLKIKVAPAKLTDSERKLGLHLTWLERIASPTTSLYFRQTINDVGSYDLLRRHEPDVIVSIGSSDIIKKKVLETAKVGVLNVHNGRIPKYRGHFGTFWEVLQGEEWSYVCIHEMVPQVDNGRILSYKRFNLREESSFLDLLIKKKRYGGILLAELLREVEELKRMPDRPLTLDPKGVPKMYFGWPTLREIRAFPSMRRLNPKMQR